VIGKQHIGNDQDGKRREQNQRGQRHPLLECGDRFSEARNVFERHLEQTGRLEQSRHSKQGTSSIEGIAVREKHVPFQPASRMRPEKEMLKTTSREKRK
jgi:hypothetical protein